MKTGILRGEVVILLVELPRLDLCFSTNWRTYTLFASLTCFISSVNLRNFKVALGRSGSVGKVWKRGRDEDESLDMHIAALSLLDSSETSRKIFLLEGSNF